jgi:VanZ family protein
MKIFSWALVALWMALIFYLSAQSELPRPESDLLDAISKKIAHNGAYAILMLLLLNALRPRARIRTAFVLLIAYAISDEIHQSFVPLRSASLRDVCFDALGGLVGVLLWQIGLARANTNWRSVVYWLLFVACGWIFLFLNIPFPQLPTQDISRLWRDAWFMFAMCGYGALLLISAVMLVADARQRGISLRFWLPVHLIGGALGALAYLATRETAPAGRPFTKTAARRIALTSLLALIALAAALLPRGSSAQLQTTLLHALPATFVFCQIVFLGIATAAFLKERAN